MGRPRINTGLPAQQAMVRAARILAHLEVEGIDFVRTDDSHAYLWHKEQLVNLYDHQHLMKYLTRLGYLKPRTENKMIIATWIIFEALQRCA